MTGTEMNLVVDNLCDRFGTTIDTLIPEIVHHNIYQCTLSIGMGVGVIVLSAIILFILLILHRGKFKNSYDFDLCCFGTMAIIGVIDIILITTIIVSTHDLLLWINSPTVSAYQWILSQIGG